MDEKKQKNRSDKLSTTIGDLLKSQGNNILDVPKKNNKKYKKFKDNLKDKNVIIDSKKNTKSNAELSLEIAINKAVKEGKLKETPTKVEFNMTDESSKENEVVVKDSSMDELVGAFLGEPEEKKPVDTNNKFVINSEYISKEGSDKKVRLDNFIKNKI